MNQSILELKTACSGPETTPVRPSINLEDIRKRSWINRC